MSFSNLYNSIVNKMPSVFIVDTESNERVGCFRIDEVDLLKDILSTKYQDAVYAHIYSLEEAVLGLMFYDINGDHVSGFELTKDNLYWDDDA